MPSLKLVLKKAGVTLTGEELLPKTAAEQVYVNTGETVETALSNKSNTNHLHMPADQAVAGFMSSTDKSKLDGISPGATATSSITNSELEELLK